MRHAAALGLAAAALAAAVTAPAAPAAAAQGPIAGTWTSLDRDGSHQVLQVRGTGNNSYAVWLYDDSATVACSGSPALVGGKGYLDGGTMLLVGALACLPGGNVIRQRIVLEFEYDAGADTLVDETGVSWQRS